MFLSWLKPSLKFSRRETPLSVKSLIKKLLNFSSCRLCRLFQQPLILNKSHERRSDKGGSQARNIPCYGICKYLV